MSYWGWVSVHFLYQECLRIEVCLFLWTWCSKVHMGSACRYCKSATVKAGKLKNGTQRYKCRYCKRYQLLEYQNKAHAVDLSNLIQIYLEGCGIRSLARIFEIAPGTVLNRIRKAAESINKPFKFMPSLSYEMDEIYTFIGNKDRELWITYAIEKESKQVVDFKVGGCRLLNKYSPTTPKRFIPIG